MNVIGRVVCGLVAGMFLCGIFATVVACAVFLVDAMAMGAGVTDGLFLCELVIRKDAFTWAFRAFLLIGVITSLVDKEPS